MRAQILTTFGGPENFAIVDVPQPQPQARQVRVRAMAIGINSLEAKIRSGALERHFPTSLPAILGKELAGIVERHGRNRTRSRKDHREFSRRKLVAIILINSFVVPHEQEEEFVSTWRSTIDHFVHAPGFIETKLHRNLGLSDQTFLYVNVAQWESVEAYREAFKDFVPAGQRIPGVKAHPGLFEVHTVVKGTQ